MRATTLKNNTKPARDCLPGCEDWDSKLRGQTALQFAVEVLFGRKYRRTQLMLYNTMADGKELWMRVAKANAARRKQTKRDMDAKMMPYQGQGRRTPGVRRTRTPHGTVRPKR